MGSGAPALDPMSAWGNQPAGAEKGAAAGAESAAERLQAIAWEVVACTACPRLRAYCQEVARVKKRAFRDQEYWGLPLPGFGDPEARLLIIGLAPAAHGGTRTGRMFTGDSSADFLVRAMHGFGFASQPWSRHREDGLVLRDAFITAAARCAPPQNRPTPQELKNCSRFLEAEFEALLPRLRVVLVLGQIAFDAYRRLLQARGVETRGMRFGHGARFRFEDRPELPLLLCSYHPSRQNTQTGKLTEAMFASVLAEARREVDREG